jgi:hypothetical protein
MVAGEESLDWLHDDSPTVSAVVSHDSDNFSRLVQDRAAALSTGERRRRTVSPWKSVLRK